MSRQKKHSITVGLPVTVTLDLETGRWTASPHLAELLDALTDLEPQDDDHHDALHVILREWQAWQDYAPLAFTDVRFTL